MQCAIGPQPDQLWCLARNECPCKAVLLSLWLSSLHMLQVQREAIQAVEQDGIVFIDEIDKIVVNQDLRYGEQPAIPIVHVCLWSCSLQ